MTVEELRKTAKDMGYNIVKIKQYEKFLPCTCGCNRREMWFGNTKERSVIYKCMRCGLEVCGENKEAAKREWNKKIKELKNTWEG